MDHVTSRQTIVIEDGHVRPPRPDEHLVHFDGDRWVCVLREHKGMACQVELAA